MQKLINEEEIIEYYDNCEIDYQLLWHLSSKMCMHYGYWDETTSNLRSALVNMNMKVAAFGGIERETEILDAGCGVGGSSIYLAKHFGCAVTGISLSEQQIITCRKNAEKHNVGQRCTFDKQNYLQTSFADATFDAVWAIESVCYAFDKIDFLKEAYRILKPGGKLIVADFYTTGSLDEKGLMHKMAGSWSIRSFAGIEEFWEKIFLTGFINGRRKDVTSHVIKSIRRLYYTFFPGIVVTNIGELLRLRNNIQTANTWSTYYQYKAYRKGLWRYMFFAAEKPK